MGHTFVWSTFNALESSPNVVSFPFLLPLWKMFQLWKNSITVCPAFTRKDIPLKDRSVYDP